MKYFYGIYLKNSSLSSALDVIRFLSEPSGMRFSHITLRGPYAKKLPTAWLHEKNKAIRGERSVLLRHPGNFFSFGQCTVFFEIDLRSLTRLWNKPDFPRGVPHLTVYDGKDRALAEQLFSMLQQYSWNIEVEVSDFRLIEPKFKPDEVLIKSFVGFFEQFQQHVGVMKDVSSVHLMGTDQRLRLIRKVLDGMFRAITRTRRSAYRPY